MRRHPKGADQLLGLGAQLHIDTLPAVTHCGGCGADYPTVAHGRVCPHCGSGDTWLLRGSEISIKEIEGA